MSLARIDTHSNIYISMISRLPCGRRARSCVINQNEKARKPRWLREKRCAATGDTQRKQAWAWGGNTFFFCVRLSSVLVSVHCVCVCVSVCRSEGTPERRSVLRCNLYISLSLLFRSFAFGVPGPDVHGHYACTPRPPSPPTNLVAGIMLPTGR